MKPRIRFTNEGDVLLNDKETPYHIKKYNNQYEIWCGKHIVSLPIDYLKDAKEACKKMILKEINQ